MKECNLFITPNNKYVNNVLVYNKLAGIHLWLAFPLNR